MMIFKINGDNMDLVTPHAEKPISRSDRRKNNKPIKYRKLIALQMPPHYLSKKELKSFNKHIGRWMDKNFPCQFED